MIASLFCGPLMAAVGQIVVYHYNHSCRLNTTHTGEQQAIAFSQKLDQKLNLLTFFKNSLLSSVIIQYQSPLLNT